MYARTSTIVNATGNIEDGIAHVRDVVMPGIADTPGCIGISLLVDRDSRSGIVTTAWESDSAMRESAERAQRLRSAAAEVWGGEPRVEQWEIAVLHREHATGDGGYARVSWVEGDAGRLDDVVSTFRVSILPTIGDMEGFCACSLLIDRDRGRAVATTTWQSRDALGSSREAVKSLREKAAAELGGRIVDVQEFEVALAHLRVPELA